MSAERVPDTPTHTPDSAALPQGPAQCKGTTRDGKPCRAYPSPTSGYCLAHDPDRREIFLAAGRKGATMVGRRVSPVDLGKVDLQTAEDVRSLLAEVVRRVAGGQLDKATAGTLVYCGQTALRAISMADLERQLGEGEAELKRLRAEVERLRGAK